MSRVHPVTTDDLLDERADDAYDLERQREVDAERDVKDADWWAERLCDVSTVKATAAELARCMVNLDAACNGCPISRDACLSALSALQKSARLDARDSA